MVMTSRSWGHASSLAGGGGAVAARLRRRPLSGSCGNETFILFPCQYGMNSNIRGGAHDRGCGSWALGGSAKFMRTWRLRQVRQARSGCDDVPAAEAVRQAAETGAAVAGNPDNHRAREDVDAVLICTPTDDPRGSDRAGGEGRQGDLLRKAGRSFERAHRACLNVVDEAEGQLMIGFNRRFDPNFAALAQAPGGGRGGQARDRHHPVARSGTAADLLHRALRRPVPRHDDPRPRHGALLLLGEEPVEVSAMGACLVDPAIGQAGDIDTAVVTLKTESGKLAQISNSRRATYGYDQRIEVHGSERLAARRQHPSRRRSRRRPATASPPIPC